MVGMAHHGTVICALVQARFVRSCGRGLGIGISAGLPAVVRWSGGQVVRWSGSSALRALVFVQLEADGVDTVALPGRLRSIGEYVTQVSVTLTAQHFGSAHVETVIHFHTHTLV